MHNPTTTDFQLSLTDNEWLFHLMLRLHVASASNEITLIGDHMKSDLLLSASYQNSDNQTMIDIKLSPTDFEGLFHLMLRLHVASTSNEITLVGDHTKSGIFPMDIMPETPTFKQLLTFN